MDPDSQNRRTWMTTSALSKLWTTQPLFTVHFTWYIESIGTRQLDCVFIYQIAERVLLTVRLYKRQWTLTSKDGERE